MSDRLLPEEVEDMEEVSVVLELDPAFVASDGAQLHGLRPSGFNRG